MLNMFVLLMTGILFFFLQFSEYVYYVSSNHPLANIEYSYSNTVSSTFSVIDHALFSKKCFM